MPRLIFKCPYIKGGTSSATAHLENYVKYMATRNGVERIDPGRSEWPATSKQKKMVEQILRDFPLSRGMFEYEDYAAEPTRTNASEFITRALEDNYNQIAKKDNYLKYIATRPRAQRVGSHGLFTQGKSYRGNIEGSDPRCSFHWVGTSDRLYVFEAPIDLLAFLTLYPDGWQQHSYVALCGTAEHAMLWMLEKNPNLRKTILCLDHDAAGIEAVGRLSDVLREHGYSQIAPLQSEYKDWDEDLKARHGLEAQPAEEHPQFVAADLVCQRIGTRCKEVQPDRAAYQIPGLLLQYRNDLHWGRFDQAMEHMETMAALSLSVVLRECKQMGTALTVEQGVRFLESHILPHQNRSILKNRADEIAMQFQSVLAKNNRQGIRTQAEKKEVASAWLELAISCAKVPVKYEADEIKRRQKEEKTQRETEPVMA